MRSLRRSGWRYVPVDVSSGSASDAWPSSPSLSKGAVARLERGDGNPPLQAVVLTLRTVGLALQICRDGEPWLPRDEVIETDRLGARDDAGRRLPPHYPARPIGLEPAWRYIRRRQRAEASGRQPPRLDTGWTFDRKPRRRRPPARPQAKPSAEPARLDPPPSYGVDMDAPPGLALVAPNTALHASWVQATAEFVAAGVFQHGSGLTPNGEEPYFGSMPWRPSELTDPERFAHFVAHLRGLADPEAARPVGMVPDTKLWITADGTYLGAVSLRHELNEHLLAEGGHIGFSVRPSAQGRGIATWALAHTLDRAQAMGIERALLTCEETNPASTRVIERCGGVLEDVRGTVRRYWIDLT